MTIYTQEQIIAPNSGWVNLGAGPMAILGDSTDEIVLFIGDAAPAATFIGLPLDLVRGVTASSASQVWAKSNSQIHRKIVIYNLPATIVTASMPPLGFGVLI